MLLYLFAILVIFATFLGGFFALKFKSKLDLLMAFSAGLLMSLVFFELLPEIEQLGRDFGFSFGNLMILAAAGFLFFHLFEKFFIIHACREKDCPVEEHQSTGDWGTMGIAIHSFLDGLVIGAGFQVSQAFGIAIGSAVIFHKISDGLNTTVLLLKNRRDKKRIFSWLAANSIMTFAGIFFSKFAPIPEFCLAFILSFFAGFFLYLGASDLLPEAHRKNSSWGLILATSAGFFIFLAISFFI
ncbi:MAG: hypothetical protein UV67_C0007G0016 [Parcubacteria group bacterium GW2011_GWC1_43_12]|nr:MAG: hypothetical protein UV34_C0005G0006 [Parcubacteria group bacterium GW2011_GWB1_42_6]KKS92250.1 MAG: hypothetical protein UV67_C0007G0016 [Parcubacteria group bacterium GW2011_GWC1_43_12]